LENNSQMNDQYDDEIDLRELFGVLWGNKIKIIGITAVFSVVSVIYALSVRFWPLHSNSRVGFPALWVS
jgi:LPS O-antigen subunit length determinant protein (WzzB/FepE family)